MPGYFLDILFPLSKLDSAHNCEVMIQGTMHMVHIESRKICYDLFEASHLCSFFAVGVEMGDWQEVWDENSGCYYYWSTLTNEVSWELPHYLADQMQSLANRWEKQTNYENFEAR